MRRACSAERGPSNWAANVSGRSVSLVLFLLSVLLVTPADAGPCSQEIAAYEQAMRELPGTTGHQSVRAQLHRQPTPESLSRSRSRAARDERADRAALERARAADARGDRATCLKALSEAQRP
jgi:hypothetical protein